MFEGFKSGSGGKYVWDEVSRQLVKISDSVETPNAGLNGPVWFPNGGGYFDKALNRHFSTKQEKVDFMKANGIMQKAQDRTGDLNCPEAGMGKRYYSFQGQKTCSRGYKYR